MSAATILVADDDAAFATAVRVRLESEGHRVVEALDAIQAIAASRRARPDLVVLDVNMPAGDGFDVLERIRAIDGLAHVPVIYVTGERTVRASYGAREAGATALLYKPLEPGRLLDAVDRALAPGGPDAADAAPDRVRALADLQLAADRWSAARP